MLCQIKKMVLDRRREKCRGAQRRSALSEASPVLVDLGVPTLFQFFLRGGLAFRISDFHFYAFARPQNLTLQVEAAALLGIVDVEELLESLHNVFDVGFAGGRRLDIEDFAGLIEGYARGGETTAALVLRSIFAGGLGLLVGFGEGAAEDPGSGNNDLGDDAMSLERVWVRILFIILEMCLINRKCDRMTYHVDGAEGASAWITRR